MQASNEYPKQGSEAKWKSSARQIPHLLSNHHACRHFDLPAMMRHFLTSCRLPVVHGSVMSSNS
jgi:hypothetical protein